MASTNQDATVYRGDSLTLDVELTTADGSAFDPTIEGVDVRYRATRNRHSPESEALIAKQAGSGIEVAPGRASITLDHADTDLAPRLYYHELKIFDGDDQFTAMVGVLIVKPSLRLARPTPSAQLRLTTAAPGVAVS